MLVRHIFSLILHLSYILYIADFNMIEYIKGELTSLTPAYAVVEASGIGYLLNITLAAFTELQGKASTRLLVHEIIREDAHVLYGFIHENERELFRLLLAVPGVGAATARIILSSIPVSELEIVIASGDHARLKSVKGIGAKTAQRIIVDLRDKIKPGEETLLIQPAVNEEVFEEALGAMVILGFPRAAAQKALRAIFRETPSADVEAAIKKALTML